jgi:hypothetical protein
MTLGLSPFLRDRNERALKTLVYSTVSYLFQEWVGHLVALATWERALVMAAAASLVSIVGSWISRYLGERGTASLTSTYAYGDKAPSDHSSSSASGSGSGFD